MHHDEFTLRAREEVQNLLTGGAPGSYSPATFGPWSQFLAELACVYEQAGAAGVKQAFEAGMRHDPALARLWCGETTLDRAVRACPPLPREATAIYQHLTPCAQWLDDYIAFASEASPRTPRSFHEAAGLFAVSVAIARRLVFPIGGTSFYPNIYVLFIAPPGRWGKTTALNELIKLLQRAGLAHLLLPDSITPEGLLLQLSTAIPDQLQSYSPYDREIWLKQRAQAAQRGWVLDEAGFLLASLKRDYNAGLLGLMLKLYDAPDELTHETVGHGRTTVRQAILSFFGATTPDNIAEHLRNKKLWGEGLWSRFALLVPQGAPAWAFFPRQLEYPAALVSGLRRVANLFPTPEARLVEEYGRTSVDIYNIPPPSTVSIVPEGFAAWEAYAKATGHELLDTGVDETLHGSYARLAAHVIKVAMILATLDAKQPPIRIELCHLARAQQIVERWRADLHRIWNDGIETEEAKLAERVLAALGRAQPGGLTVRELCRQLHIKAKDAREVLELLDKAGQVTNLRSAGAAGREVELWVRS